MSLREAAQQVLEYARWINNEQAIVPYEQMINLRIMLADEIQVEPVAYCTLEQLAHLKLTVPSDDKIALYAAPPKREPMTAEQLLDLAREHVKCHERDFLPNGWLAYAVAIERAHGIGGEE